jgi:hypothetical protein
MASLTANLTPENQRLSEQRVDALQALVGVHPGYAIAYRRRNACMAGLTGRVLT